jgi:ATP-dependent Lon protease
VKEKAVAALRSGMRRVVLPAANQSDLELLPQEVREQVQFELVRTMDEVMDAVLVQSPMRARRGAEEESVEESVVGLPVPHG